MDSNASPLPLVLLHAFPLNARMWHNQRDEFGGQRLVLTPDFPGFGAAPGLDDEAPTMDALAGYVEHMLDANGVDRCVLGGLSMGGYVALACMRTMRNRIAGLILADTKAGVDDDAGRKGRIAAMDRIGSGDYAGYIETLLHKLLAESTRRTFPEIVDTVRGIMLDTHPESASAALLAMLSRADSTALLPGFDVPTAVIVGESDAITSTDEARLMADAIPDASLTIIPNAGHLSNIENPDAFNDAVRELIVRAESLVVK